MRKPGHALAASHAATRVVLLGDPQQLEQPKKGSHPKGVEASALGHMLGDHLTIPKDRGIFLPITWRLAPSTATFTSDLFYEGLLTSKPGLENQSLRLTNGAPSSGRPEVGTPPGQLLIRAGNFNGSGLHLLEVPHEGNHNSSEEEIEAIAALISHLTQAPSSWINENREPKRVTGEDILVVASARTDRALAGQQSEARRRPFKRSEALAGPRLNVPASPTTSR